MGGGLRVCHAPDRGERGRFRFFEGTPRRESSGNHGCAGSGSGRKFRKTTEWLEDAVVVVVKSFLFLVVVRCVPTVYRPRHISFDRVSLRVPTRNSSNYTATRAQALETNTPLRNPQ